MNRKIRQTLERLEAIEDGVKFHAAMRRLSARTLRATLATRGSGRFIAGNWADEYLPAAIAREAAKGPEAPEGAQGFVARIRKDIGDEAAQQAAPFSALQDAAQAACPMNLGAARKLAKILAGAPVPGLDADAQEAAAGIVADMLGEWELWTERY